jgi:hypothetical protein
MSYIIFRGRWCNIIVLNVHAPCEDKGDDVKDNTVSSYWPACPSQTAVTQYLSRSAQFGIHFQLLRCELRTETSKRTVG